MTADCHDAQGWCVTKVAISGNKWPKQGNRRQEVQSADPNDKGSRGRTVERPYTNAELAAFREGLSGLGLSYDQLTACLGGACYDVYLNDVAYWRCVPARVWKYTIGGYQVMKKWLSYRERALLGRDLRPDEARYVTEMTRRIAAVLLLEPALDENYERVKADTYPWPGG